MISWIHAKHTNVHTSMNECEQSVHQQDACEIVGMCYDECYGEARSNLNLQVKQSWVLHVWVASIWTRQHWMKV